MFSINARLINPESLDPDDLLVRCGFQKGGPVQCTIDQSVIDWCIKGKYVPASPDRTLEFTAQPSTEIGSGMVIWNTPYARYQYYGVVYGPNIPRIDRETGVLLGYFSPPGKKKHPTDKKLTYDKGQNANAGPFWVERMKADHMGDILDEARKCAQEELRKHG